MLERRLFSRENQDCGCSSGSKALVDRSAEAFGEQQLSSSVSQRILLACPVVGDTAFDDRGRREKFHAYQASIVTKSVAR